MIFNEEENGISDALSSAGNWTAAQDTATLDVLTWFHRDPTGYVHLHFDPVGNSSIELDQSVRWPVEGTKGGYLPVLDLHGWREWPEARLSAMRATVERDAYATLNTLWGTIGWTGDEYRRLNAAWVDCDCWELEAEEAEERVEQCAEDGLLPAPSIFLRSGEGVWFFWLLTGAEDRPHLPPEAYHRNRERVKATNRTIAEILRVRYPELQPDFTAAQNVTIHPRIAGSLHSEMGVRSTYRALPGESGEPPAYRLAELVEALGLPAPRRRRRPRNARKDVRRVPGRRRGWMARYERPLEELRKLAEFRGGFDQGTRRHACYLLATLMQGAGHLPGDVEKAVMRLAKECRPPLSCCQRR